MKRRAKIIATIGPASENKNMLQALIQAGINIARINFSHGDKEEHGEVIGLLRKTSTQLNKPLAIMQDLQGPKIRTGILPAAGVLLEEGQSITLSTDPKASGENIIPADFPDLPEVVKVGGRILLDDGNLELKVTAVEAEHVVATVVLGGLLKSHKGINLPGAHLTIPGFTEKDQEDLFYGLDAGIDAVAISFVRSGQDITRVREAIKQHAPDKVNTPVIAKLERPEALDNLDEIIEFADGVMVARGDLGVEMPPEMVPNAQKRIIETANCKGKFVITATQMLESMIDSPRPTRAEASDVANAIYDGTDAVMLSGETAMGKYPVEAVEMMEKIVWESEQNLKQWGRWQGTPTSFEGDDAAHITRAARELAHDLNVAAVAVFTQSGRTARLMSKAMPRVPILGFTPDEATYHRMCFYWGVFPYLVPFSNSIEDMLAHVDAAMIASTPIKPGQQVVIISGFPVGASRLPNLALLYTVGEKFQQ